MNFDGAVIREQGVTFAVASVRRGLINSPAQRDETIAYLNRFFGGIPIVLMEQDQNGTPTWYGRQDLTRFLQNIPVGAVPWRRYDG